MADEERRDDAGDDVGDEVEILEIGDEPVGELLSAEELEVGLEGVEGGDEVAELRAEIADLRDRSMRTLADFDNYRKRTERERRDVLRYAAVEPLRDVLEVVDNLERAVAAGGSEDDLRTGLEMILRQLGDMLRRHGVEAVPAVGERFDPAVHEGVRRLEDPQVEGPTVVEELQRGYRLHDRLLRPARVVVAVPPEEA
jgi:molecular chaperone GrpE